MRDLIQRHPLVFALTSGLALLAATPAWAQLEDIGDARGGGGGHFGLGIQTTLVTPFVGAGLGVLTGPSGELSLGWDAGRFRVDGLIGLAHVEDAATTFQLGGQFFYVLDRGKTADFAIGPALMFGFYDPEVGDGRFRVVIEGAGQIRVFLASNVGLLATAGLGFSVGKGGLALALGGELSGALGLVYYF